MNLLTRDRIPQWQIRLQLLSAISILYETTENGRIFSVEASDRPEIQLQTQSQEIFYSNY